MLQVRMDYQRSKALGCGVGVALLGLQYTVAVPGPDTPSVSVVAFHLSVVALCQHLAMARAALHCSQVDAVGTHHCLKVKHLVPAQLFLPSQ